MSGGWIVEPSIHVLFSGLPPEMVGFRLVVLQHQGLRSKSKKHGARTLNKETPISVCVCVFVFFGNPWRIGKGWNINLAPGFQGPCGFKPQVPLLHISVGGFSGLPWASNHENPWVISSHTNTLGD